MEQNEQTNPFELGQKYLEAAGYPMHRVFKYKVFLKLFADLVESSTFPVSLGKGFQQDDFVSANTLLHLTCNKNNCNRKFSATILKLFNDYLNYGMCCPVCRNKYRNEQEEITRKILERDLQYANLNPRAADAYAYEEPNFYEKRKLVKNAETGRYETVEMTPQEVVAYKKKLENNRLIELEKLKNNPNYYEELRKKRKEIEGHSRRYRRENMINALQGDYELKLESVGGSSYNGSSRGSEDVSVNNTALSLDERISRNIETGGSRTVLSDKGYDDLGEEVLETYGENISKEAIWDSIAKDFIDGRGEELDAGNVFNKNLDFKLDSPL